MRKIIDQILDYVITNDSENIRRKSDKPILKKKGGT